MATKAVSGKRRAPKKATAKTVAAIADKAPKEIRALRKLAVKARVGTQPMVRIYQLVPGKKLTAKAPRGVTRAGGPPIGVLAKSRPKYAGKPMEHLITLDLDEVPTLREHKKLAKVRALALFISNAKANKASSEGTRETKVVLLSADDIKRGEWAGAAVSDPTPIALAVWPIDVPAAVFSYDPWESDDEPNAKNPLYQLFSELMSGNRAGGGVIHWSGESATKGFLFQFTGDLVDVNLGDAGTMYVYLDRAYWAGH